MRPTPIYLIVSERINAFCGNRNHNAITKLLIFLLTKCFPDHDIVILMEASKQSIPQQEIDKQKKMLDYCSINTNKVFIYYYSYFIKAGNVNAKIVPIILPDGSERGGSEDDQFRLNMFEGAPIVVECGARFTTLCTAGRELHPNAVQSVLNFGSYLTEEFKNSEVYEKYKVYFEWLTCGMVHANEDTELGVCAQNMLLLQLFGLFNFESYVSHDDYRAAWEWYRINIFENDIPTVIEEKDGAIGYELSDPINKYIPEHLSIIKMFNNMPREIVHTIYQYYRNKFGRIINLNGSDVLVTQHPLLLMFDVFTRGSLPILYVPTRVHMLCGGSRIYLSYDVNNNETQELIGTLAPGVSPQWIPLNDNPEKTVYTAYVPILLVHYVNTRAIYNFYTKVEELFDGSEHTFASTSQQPPELWLGRF